jgi:hypothetical protein
MEQQRRSKIEIEEMINVLQSELAEVKAEGSTETGYDRKNRAICSICGGRYTKTNVTTHRKTRKHRMEVEHLEAIRRIVRSKTLDGR